MIMGDNMLLLKGDLSELVGIGWGSVGALGFSLRSRHASFYRSAVDKMPSSARTLLVPLQVPEMRILLLTSSIGLC